MAKKLTALQTIHNFPNVQNVFYDFLQNVLFLSTSFRIGYFATQSNFFTFRDKNYFRRYGSLLSEVVNQKCFQGLARGSIELVSEIKKQIVVDLRHFVLIGRMISQLSSITCREEKARGNPFCSRLFVLNGMEDCLL